MSTFLRMFRLQTCWIGFQDGWIAHQFKVVEILLLRVMFACELVKREAKCQGNEFEQAAREGQDLLLKCADLSARGVEDWWEGGGGCVIGGRPFVDAECFARVGELAGRAV